MAPGTRRGNRGAYPEHDDFEGLPVRQWRHEWVNITPPAPQEQSQLNDKWSVELPHGMPKDYHLLPPHAQELLRAARSGRMYKRPPPADDDADADADAAVADKEGTAARKDDDDPATQGFAVRLWRQVPRQSEGPAISHLAKRRKHTVTLNSRALADAAAAAAAAGGVGPGVPTVTRATVRRIDAAGNPYLQNITLAEGQAVEGEIISTTVVAAPAAAKAAGPAKQPTPVKRRPPPPKRKARGPGRGRKKKVPAPAAVQPVASAPAVADLVGEAKPEEPETVGTKADADNTTNQDSEMAEAVVVPSDDEADDDGDDGDDQDDGTPDVEGTDQDRDHEMTDSPAPPSTGDANATPLPGIEGGTHAHQPTDALRPLHLAPPPSASPQLEGSPLKNVILPPADPPADPLTQTPSATAALEQSEAAMDIDPPQAEKPVAESVPSQSALERSPDVVVPITIGSSAPIVEHVASTTEAVMSKAPRDSKADKVPGPPTIGNGAGAKNDIGTFQADAATSEKALGVPPEPVGQPEPPVEDKGPSPAPVSVPEPPALKQGISSTPASIPASKPSPPTGAAPASEPQHKAEPSPAPAADSSDDDGPDLLGGLEAELERQASESKAITPVAVAVPPAVMRSTANLWPRKEPGSVDGPATLSAPTPSAGYDAPKKGGKGKGTKEGYSKGGNAH